MTTENRAELERRIPTLGRTSRRGLEFALAATAVPRDRARLSRLLSSSTRDLVALAAAEMLAAGELGVVDLWRVAQTFYWHGLYDRAAPVFENLDTASHGQVPRWEVAYLRGRCSFRRGDWPAAVEWYSKAIARSPAGE